MKKIVSGFILSLVFTSVIADDNLPTLKLYGFVRSDIYVNSRVNEESTDGLYNFFPKPSNIVNGTDLNEVPNSEMLSAYTRLGLDLNGEEINGIKISAKIETDFAGTSSNYYLMRIRQAYINLAWEKSQLLIGQTWHPLFSSLIPSMVSINTGTPFQPFNRSPQISLTHKLNKNWTWKSSAIYQNQYTSTGPIGFSSSYLKNSIIPNLFSSIEYRENTGLIGFGIDYKRIKPLDSYLNSASLILYGALAKGKMQFKTKSILGQNLSDQIMIGGYALAKDAPDGISQFTNLNTLHQWFNFTYGQKVQVGVFAGSSLHLGSNKELNPQVFAYGRGYYSNGDEMISHLWRVAPFIIKNMGNLKIGAEYNFTSANYGQLQATGKISDKYNVDNHRLIGVIMYQF